MTLRSDRSSQVTDAAVSASKYYLSGYVNPPGLYRLAGVYFRHDENVSLWRLQGTRVSLMAHWQLERITGQKGHVTPFRSQAELQGFLCTLLSEFDLTFDDITDIWGIPVLGKSSQYGFANTQGHSAHNLAHLFSAVLLDSQTFFEGTLLGMAIDFAPDDLSDERSDVSWYAGCVVRAGSITLFPIESPGAIYAAARDRFKTREGTLMALASATNATITPPAGDGALSTTRGKTWFGGPGGLTQADELIAELERAALSGMSLDTRFTDRECVISAVMKVVQELSYLIIARNVAAAVVAAGPLNFDTVTLAMAGGSSLNCPVNSRVMESFGFNQFQGPPCVDDSGQALGLGLGMFLAMLPDRFDFTFPGAYLGSLAREPNVGVPSKYTPFTGATSGFDPDTVVKDLIQGPIVWIDGRSEIGPRALGHRSILADSRSSESKHRLNVIKNREWWRPVAPIVIAEHAASWFENAQNSPYMLRTFRLKSERIAQVPAISHIDASARIQTVQSTSNDYLAQVLLSFFAATGVPMLCNTSLNSSGEPIIESVSDAINFALRAGIAVVYSNGLRIELCNHASYVGYAPGRRCADFFSLDASSSMVEVMNPYHLSEIELNAYLSRVGREPRLDTTTEREASIVRTLIRELFERDASAYGQAKAALGKANALFAAFGTYPLIAEPRASSTGETPSDRDEGKPIESA